jgi:hypothetical protein
MLVDAPVAVDLDEDADVVHYCYVDDSNTAYCDVDLTEHDFVGDDVPVNCERCLQVAVQFGEV